MHVIICPSNCSVPLCISGLKPCVTLWTCGFTYSRPLDAMILTLKNTFTIKLLSQIKKYGKKKKRSMNEIFQIFTNPIEVCETAITSARAAVLNRLL